MSVGNHQVFVEMRPTAVMSVLTQACGPLDSIAEIMRGCAEWVLSLRKEKVKEEGEETTISCRRRGKRKVEAFARPFQVTNLQALTSIQSYDAARPKSRLGFALRHSHQSKSSPAGCSWEHGRKSRGGKRQGWLGIMESNLEGWSGNREQCGLSWSVNICRLGLFCFLVESDQDEQRRCGHFTYASKAQETEAFSD
ncbi:hypothetical protein XENOCAPTIV_022470 [Xenoophorus captivus]|uniref:Uncharacterized protein n=1 Tax=Xenoophorus captivus TaxID=1517983 RepID=A0ABV0QX84_9TELE